MFEQEKDKKAYLRHPCKSAYTHTANTHRYTSLYTCAGTSKAYPRWASLARSPSTFQRCGRCLQSFHLQGSATHVHVRTIEAQRSTYRQLITQYNNSEGNHAHVSNFCLRHRLGFISFFAKGLFKGSPILF